MKITILEYPGCSTCRRAKKFLESRGIFYEDRHIVENRPNEEELRGYIKRSALPVKKFFNTSGQVYRQMGLKDKLGTMPEEEQIALLAENGMLVKRPILLADEEVLVGFKEADWDALLSKQV